MISFCFGQLFGLLRADIVQSCIARVLAATTHFLVAFKCPCSHSFPLSLFAMPPLAEVSAACPFVWLVQFERVSPASVAHVRDNVNTTTTTDGRN